MATPMISAQNVHKSFGQLEVLKGIDLEVQPGEVACLLGPSGSGKSTFLRCVNHLDKATAGRLYVDGELIGYREKNGTLYEISEKEAAEQRSDIGMVFQSFNLFPHRTVIENIIEAPVQVKKIPEETARARAMELLEDVGLASKANNYPVQLSGGQQQRVACARALVSRPEIIFGDEPTGNLDSNSSAEVLDILRTAVDQDEQTVVIVTHDAKAASYADRVVFLADGRLVNELHNPTMESIHAVMAEIEG